LYPIAASSHLNPSSLFLQLIKEKLLDLLGKEEEDGSHDENVSTCDPVPNHSESLSHTVTVPLQAPLGTLEEIAC
ncbi:ASIC2 protein, partial [Callaeas wilsoni]|nr:ASIC2 protein [Callaeas wilsoni]